MTTANLLHAQRLTLNAPGGRRLLQDLNLNMDRGDRVALVGRNGVGKSSLVRVLAGAAAADSGEVRCSGLRALVPQGIDADCCTGSPGEVRRRRLHEAIASRPDLLLLDEPTHDLDQAGLAWLRTALRGFREGLIVVSHDRRLLHEFQDFFVVAESGCHHFSGSCEELTKALGRAHAEHEARYVSQLERLTAFEQRQYRLRQRRGRKKNVGRVRELDRATPKILLNSKRSYAQEKQGKRNLIQQARLETARSWAVAARRSLGVALPLQAVLPRLADVSSDPITRLQQVAARSEQFLLFENLSLALNRDRLAVTGPNGSGKSTLLELLAGVRQPERGTAYSEPQRIGYIAQNAVNWCLDESLLQQLLRETHTDLAAAASCIRAHSFPLALAQRPLLSLSPGERLRAALICLLQRPRAPELLILDEPTSHLDFLGYDALQALLASWPGGLVVASHDQEFLRAIKLSAQLALAPVPLGRA